MPLPAPFVSGVRLDQLLVVQGVLLALLTFIAFYAITTYAALALDSVFTI